MKIRTITALGLRGSTPEGGWDNELRPEDCVHTLVAVHTTGGLTGFGSVFTNDSLVRASLDVMRSLWEGESALEPERVSEKLHQHTFWLGRGGSLTHTISGIDIALWDLLGKAAGQPVGRLLGGRHRERVKPYASLLMREPGELAAEIQQWKSHGFAAFKIGWGPYGRVNAAKDEAIVRAARDAAGSASLLMVDAGGSDAFWPNGLKWALRSAEMLARYDVSWFEEALHPDALADYVELRKASRIPISGGEVLTRRQGFQPWLEAGAFDIVQPDATKCGGISESRRIAWMAEQHGIKYVPHGWNTALGLASDLHLASAIPRTDLVEYLTGSPYVDDIVAAPWKLDSEGMLAIPDVPGLGVELNTDALARYGGGPQAVAAFLKP